MFRLDQLGGWHGPLAPISARPWSLIDIQTYPYGLYLITIVWMLPRHEILSLGIVAQLNNLICIICRRLPEEDLQPSPIQNIEVESIGKHK